MKNEDLLNQLKQFSACEEAVTWTNGMDLKTAWNKCERADWMLWYIFMAKIGTERDRIHIICDCAATALKYVPKGEDRPRLAIEAARNYADNPTEENKAAANAAAYAANATAYAANAANAAVYAAADAAAHKKMCNMIRDKIKLED